MSSAAMLLKIIKDVFRRAQKHPVFIYNIINMGDGGMDVPSNIWICSTGMQHCPK